MLLKLVTQVEIAKHLDMSERNVRDVLNGLAKKYGSDKDWWKTADIADIRIKYIRDMREKAAGRGGDDQLNLSKQRAEESLVKTAMLRLEYNEKIKTLVLADDAADAITDWCVFANREYQLGITKIVGEIQSTYKIEVENKLVEKIAGNIIKRIQDNAESIAANLIADGDDILTTESSADSGVD